MSPSQPAGRPIGKGRVAPFGALLLAVLVAAAGAGGASAAEPLLPVIGAELPRGTLTVRDTGADPEAAARRRVVDGDPSDWAGERTGFAGAVTYSRGELVHEDHLWDASGAAAGDVAGRTALLDALAQADPALYRAEAVTLYLPSGTHYGAGPVDLVADLTEVRVALAPEGGLTLLARTTEMTAERQPAVLVLLDTRPGTRRHAVPFRSGLTTEAADVAVLLSSRGGVAVDLETGARTAVPAAGRADGYDNAVEGAVPRGLLGDGAPRIAVAAGRLDPASGELAPRGAGPAIANVAFRAEPARPSFEKRQALALHGGSIDAFFTRVDVDRLRAGTTQETVPGPGYHDRIFRSDPAMSREQGRDGVLQHYGAYVPKGLPAGTPRPSSLFLHGSGNDAHDLPLILPGLTRALGDELGAVVVAPKGRTAFSLWEGAGLADVLEATQDATRAFGLDRARTRLAGYSMGGLGAFLLSALMPDRFAASYSIAGPVGGDVRSPGVGLRDLPDVRRLFRNLRSVPTLISGGGIDNNVPLTNGLAAAATLSDLGYRHRLQAFPADHHFSPGAIDRWADAVAYLRPFDRVDPDPPRVSFVRDMAIEHEVRTAALSDQELRPAGGHRHEFGGAFWLDELTPADPEGGSPSPRHARWPSRNAPCAPSRSPGWARPRTRISGAVSPGARSARRRRAARRATASSSSSPGRRRSGWTRGACASTPVGRSAHAWPPTGTSSCGCRAAGGPSRRRSYAVTDHASTRRRRVAAWSCGCLPASTSCASGPWCGVWHGGWRFVLRVSASSGWAAPRPRWRAGPGRRARGRPRACGCA